MREELQATVDKLPAARSEEGRLHRPRRKEDHRGAQDAREQMGSDIQASAWQNRQRDQELLELLHQEEAHCTGP
ncbi:unnamed protein product [Linum tenue]|nr:unnamed protein product [Linum tenue]